MNRLEMKKYYENKIDDIQDEHTREKFLDKLEEIDDMLFELDTKIDEEVENQEDYIEDEIQDDYEYFRRVVNQ